MSPRRDAREDAQGAEERRGISPLTRHLLGLAVYYALLSLAGLALWKLAPDLNDIFSASRISTVRKSSDLLKESARAVRVARVDLALATGLSIAGTIAVTIPVAWVYILTRRKKGFTQSVAHTLLILPIAVAGVVTLVHDSLALAFSLAGIVAAVRFRNTLEDTKDAVYIFVVTGIGISAAVGDLVIGFVMSLLFNTMALVLWLTEFGRAPARLEGSPAVRRLERARAQADAGGEFVTSLDKEVLAALSPAQLESLASRAWRRRQLKDDIPGADRRFPFNALLVVHATEIEPVQLAVEGLLVEEAKRWELGALMPEEGRTRLEYLVRFRKRTDRNAFLATLRARTGPQLTGVELK